MGVARAGGPVRTHHPIPAVFPSPVGPRARAGGTLAGPSSARRHARRLSRTGRAAARARLRYMRRGWAVLIEPRQQDARSPRQPSAERGAPPALGLTTPDSWEGRGARRGCRDIVRRNVGGRLHRTGVRESLRWLAGHPTPPAVAQDGPQVGRAEAPVTPRTEAYGRDDAPTRESLDGLRVHPQHRGKFRGRPADAPGFREVESCPGHRHVWSLALPYSLRRS